MSERAPPPPPPPPGLESSCPPPPNPQLSQENLEVHANISSQVPGRSSHVSEPPPPGLESSYPPPPNPQLSQENLEVHANISSQVPGRSSHVSEPPSDPNSNPLPGPHSNDTQSSVSQSSSSQTPSSPRPITLSSQSGRKLSANSALNSSHVGMCNGTNIDENVNPKDANKCSTVVAIPSISDTPNPDSSKKKRSRWGSPDAEPAKKRRSRWGSSSSKVALPSGMANASDKMTPEQMEALTIKLRLQDIQRKINNIQLAIPSDPRDRSPSPPPQYDSAGKRTNTRELRTRTALMNTRMALLQRVMVLNPNFKPPPDYKPPKLEKKLYIPEETHPDYNFFGLILGPRGNTQKRMERETGCRISIRGKGTSKQGKKPFTEPQPGDDDKTHVLIEAFDQKSLGKATKMIEKLLAPTNQSIEVHKATQLRELATINGTVPSQIRCRLCGGIGHKIHDCPNRTGGDWKPANITCSLCGDSTHPTTDCRRRKKRSKLSEEQSLNKEYASFMAELAGSDAPDNSPATSSSKQGCTPNHPQQQSTNPGRRPKTQNVMQPSGPESLTSTHSRGRKRSRHPAKLALPVQRMGPTVQRMLPRVPAPCLPVLPPPVSAPMGGQSVPWGIQPQPLHPWNPPLRKLPPNQLPPPREPPPRLPRPPLPPPPKSSETQKS
eukprot:301606_1